jgi:hypothetical protein
MPVRVGSSEGLGRTACGSLGIWPKVLWHWRVPGFVAVNGVVLQLRQATLALKQYCGDYSALAVRSRACAEILLGRTGSVVFEEYCWTLLAAATTDNLKPWYLLPVLGPYDFEQLEDGCALQVRQFAGGSCDEEGKLGTGGAHVIAYAALGPRAA